ncbi:hypothetical protein [Streptomyces sp. MI02-7b]|uniref:hypothetical protein n=1 Tax=Streptomyces sp. MI02-7b TaxID=462941 RepID=UPI0029AF4D09|nr:hypothetical protein [Streptomyces sp. MI02-7b]MDX3076606.1 hypothetical protein [Streptomyces sp. MI02-7b]
MDVEDVAQEATMQREEVHAAAAALPVGSCGQPFSQGVAQGTVDQGPQHWPRGDEQVAVQEGDQVPTLPLALGQNRASRRVSRRSGRGR